MLLDPIREAAGAGEPTCVKLYFVFQLQARFFSPRAASYFSPLGTSCKSEALEEVGNVAGNKDLLLFFFFHV